MKTQSHTGGVILSFANVLTEDSLLSDVCVCAFHYISVGMFGKSDSSFCVSLASKCVHLCVCVCWGSRPSSQSISE